MNAIKAVEEAYKKEKPPFRVGDTISVNLKIKEGEKERIQTFTGICIARRGGGIAETFTVRKISYGIGVEKVIPIHSPLLESVKVVKEGVVRRAKLYYLRDKKGKAAKVKEKTFTGKKKKNT
ncbi:MAG TPA: 50S ribosomal protein L19 [Nitrospirae bacterium]|nr:50S ribosomal protein L19 [bacterium BMS3Bbin09]HDH34039.1 50S ribosomal protein L19 [Nitrospirota bacterium]HDN94514.1 50S ribosomal protein L19 [Nitrospirota bacterium]HDZ84817.1 50S ribosomal protein L19 [Nitrospirota bacterium]